MNSSKAKTTAQMVQQVVACLHAGGVVLLPTDTVLGLAVMPQLSHAVNKLYAMKSRPRAKALPVMVANIEQVEDLGVSISQNIRRLTESLMFPGALTIVASTDGESPHHWLWDRTEVAFRAPDDAFLLEILCLTGPLLVTSANLAGEPTPLEIHDVLAQLQDTPDYVVEGLGKSSLPSTLVNCTVTPAKIERIGAFSEIEISKFVDLQHD
ncbi:MAG: L-threonylcarbamoyladenylate synthase [Planktomarina sp.]|nr:L-threonylcarbamoyladenylate synthase [Planktomarina sp.]